MCAVIVYGENSVVVIGVVVWNEKFQIFFVNSKWFYWILWERVPAVSLTKSHLNFPRSSGILICREIGAQKSAIPLVPWWEIYKIRSTDHVRQREMHLS